MSPDKVNEVFDFAVYVRVTTHISSSNYLSRNNVDKFPQT